MYHPEFLDHQKLRKQLRQILIYPHTWEQKIGHGTEMSTHNASATG